MGWLDKAIAAGDLDELIKGVDRLCAAREWAELEQLCERARQAHERGHQLWPAAAHGEYRLALEAPAEFACAAIRHDQGFFGFGPLSEVVVATHDWSELDPHLEPGPTRTTVANEFAARGVDLTHAVDVDVEMFGVPLAPEAFEPAYPRVVYRAGGIEVERLDIPRPAGDLVPTSPYDDDPDGEADDACRALASLTEHWAGPTTVATVEGRLGEAIAATGASGYRLQAITRDQALGLLAHIAAGAPMSGRRRGYARGRSAAWWVMAEVAAVDSWPIDPDELAAASGPLEWAVWDDGPRAGLSLQLAVYDPTDELAWAIDAHDPPPEPSDTA